MHSSIIHSLKYKKSLPESIYKIIKKRGCVIGSFVYGGWDKNNSDIDCIIQSKYVSFESLLVYGFYLTNEYEDDTSKYQSIYVKNKSGDILNILIMDNDYEYRTWKKAHSIMIKLCNIPFLNKAFKNKENRVGMFEMLKKIYKNTYDV